MAFKLSPRAKNFANRAKEVWRSSHLSIKALPLVAALGLVSFTAPINVGRSPAQVLTQKAAQEMMVDNWARTDRIISRAAAGDLTGKEYADHLNEMDWFDTLAEYNKAKDNWRYSPKLNGRFGTFYYFEPKKSEIRQVNFNFDELGAVTVFKDVFTQKQVAELADVFDSATKRLGTYPKENEYALKGPSLNEGAGLKSFVYSKRFDDPTRTFMAARLFSGEIKNVLSFEELVRIRKIVAETDPGKIDHLCAHYSSLNQSYSKAEKPVGTIAILGLLALGTAIRSRQFLREKKASGLNLRSRAEQLSSDSPYSVLRNSGFGPVYSFFGSLSPEASDVKEWFAEHVAQSAFADSTRRDIRRAQPLKPDELVRYLADCKLQKRKPLLYGFWGGHKESDAKVADEYDDLALKNLRATVDSMVQRGLKPEMRLIFSDLHSMDFNGIPRQDVEKYYASMRSLARKYGFKVVRLSGLYRSREWRSLENEVRPEAEAHAQELLSDDALADSMKESASRHSLFVQSGQKTSDEVVRTYVTERLFEGKMLSRLKGWQGIHWSYADPKTADLLPETPTLFFHSFRRGDSRVPWFTEGKPLEGKPSRRFGFIPARRPA